MSLTAVCRQGGLTVSPGARRTGRFLGRLGKTIADVLQDQEAQAAQPPMPPVPATVRTSGPCSACRWLRPGSSVAGPLLALIPHSMQAQAAVAIGSARDSERSQIHTEHIRRDTYIDQKTDEWAYRPVLYEYCGVHEPAGKRYVLEVKNDMLSCTDYADATVSLAPGTRPCTTCEHHDVPDVTAFNRIGQLCARAGQSALSVFGQRIRSPLETMLTPEVMEALEYGGVLASEPMNLPVCRLYSSDTRFSVGPIVNPTGSCPGWSSALPQPSKARELERLWRRAKDARRDLDDVRSRAHKKGRLFLLDTFDQERKVRDHELAFVERALVSLRFEINEARAITEELRAHW
jgi:hypothetical protein